ncbi:TniQ family protein [Streptosporangium sp. NPDC023615]|uniref:TniQ family protein n=1 Tax=Streptosporangium sp. NPDC023615 TaxID=3154794 RepID=UPI00342818D8
MVVWPRRLALVVTPAPGESVASWVDRLAVRNGCPPWVMAESLGLDLRPVSGDVRSLAYGVVATTEVCEAISAATGVGAEGVRDMHLGVFNGSALDLTGVRVGDKESVCRAEARESRSTSAAPPSGRPYPSSGMSGGPRRILAWSCCCH